MKRFDFRNILDLFTCQKQFLHSVLSTLPTPTGALECSLLPSTLVTSSNPGGFQFVDLGGQVLLLIINCVQFRYLARSCRLCSPECGLVRRQAWQAAVVDATRGLLCERGCGRAPLRRRRALFAPAKRAFVGECKWPGASPVCKHLKMQCKTSV